MKGVVRIFGLAVVSCLLLCCLGCSASGGYQKMDMKDAAEWMEQNEGSYALVDVRTDEEYESGHIPGALLVPVEQIREGNFDGLPAKDETLLVYCRTGRRAEDAADLLAKEGYSRIYVIGGIFDWTGEVATGPAAE